MFITEQQAVVNNLKQETISMVKNLTQHSMHDAEMILNYICGELKQRKQEAR